MMKNFILIFLFLGIVTVTNGQTNSFQISGTLTDSISKQPISFATVIIKNDKKAQLKSAVSAKDGAFLLKGLLPGNYFVHIIHVGYQQKIIPIKLDNSSPALASILLSPVANQLQGVTIKGDRPLIKQEIDRISYDIKADPEHKVSNVLEMMRKVPLLSVDGEDNIQLQGNSNYKILINGRPSGMMERNPKDILKSMPASSIERIEVITTPPAKYDGEGLAGIINIITFKKADNGTNGTVNLSHRFPVGGPGVGGTFTLKSGKFGIATNAGGSLSSSPLLNNSNFRTTVGSNATSLNQAGTRDVSGKSGYVGAELSYEIDSLNLISAQLNYNASGNDNFNTQLSELRNTTSLLQRYQLNNSLNGSGDGIDAALNYQLGFKKDKNQLLTISYRYYQFDNQQFNTVNLFNKTNYEVTDYQQDNTNGSTEQTVQIDYVRPYKKINIEAGAKAIFRDNISDFQYLSSDNSGVFLIDPLRTNAFDNQQDVYALYNTYQFSLKDWGVKAGVRAEWTEINADFGALALSNSSFNIIPSISVMRKFKNMSSINFGFSSRIQRPGINQLNPFVDRSNPNFETTGNPDLKPMSGQSIEASYSSFKKLTVNINARAMFYDNVIMPRVTTDPTTNITRSSYGNTGSATLMGVNVSVGYPFSSKFKVNLSAAANYGIVKGEVNGEMLTTKGLMRRAFTTISYRPSKTWQTNATVNYNGPNFTLQSSMNSMVTSSLSVSKDLMDGKFSISVAANNIFNKYRNAINTIDGPSFTQQSFNQNYQRGFTTSLNYKFGRLKEAIKKNKKGISNNDVSGGSL